MPSVLITRPFEVAAPLAAELERLGYRAVIESLLSIAPLATPRPDGAFDAVIVTSGSALTALENRREDIADLISVPCFCVGPRTADKAKSFGFRNVQNTDGDGMDLARLIGSVLAGKKAAILHIAGRAIDSKAQKELERQGHRMTGWPVYEAMPVAAFSTTTRALLEKRQLDAVVVFSPRTAETLVNLLSEKALETCCASLAAICLSDRVIGALQPLQWRQLAVAAAPSEKAVIARLNEICPVRS